LQAIDENIWVVETQYDIIPGGPFKFPDTMTIVRLGDGGLLLVNPVELTDAIGRLLAEVGEVTHVVTQTTFHYRFLGDYQEAFATAKLIGTPAQQQKPEVQHIRFDGYLQDDKPIAHDAITQVTFSGHAFDETALVHHDSKTLMVTDLALNGRAPVSTFFNFYAWLWGVHGCCGCPHYHRQMVMDKPAAVASMQRILALDFERIVFGHGHPVHENAKPLFEKMWTEVFDAC
jgi:glyoxylase-like metal-dependent hydrolase (beta-lactamase superfamily II)